MSEQTAGQKMIDGAKEALAIAQGRLPSASITLNGYRYVPASTLASLMEENAELKRRVEELEAAKWQQRHNGER